MHVMSKEEGNTTRDLRACGEAISVFFLLREEERKDRTEQGLSQGETLLPRGCFELGGLYVRGKTTRKIRVLYTESLYVRINRFVKKRPSVILADLIERDHGRFREAAHDCARLGVTPLEWVSAQFEVFDAVSSIKGKTLLPKPGHLTGPGAERRLRSVQEGGKAKRTEAESIAHDRRSRPGGEEKGFNPDALVAAEIRRDRKLKSMACLLGITPEEVLRRFPFACGG